jgi:hypothetical protein
LLDFLAAIEGSVSAADLGCETEFQSSRAQDLQKSWMVKTGPNASTLQILL